MPVTWTYDDEQHLLHFRLQGGWVTAAVARGMLQDICAAGHWDARLRVLVDVREVDVWSVPPYADLWLLVRSLEGLELPARMAFLARPGALFGLARTLERLTNGPADRVAAFTAEAECLVWLLAPPSRPPAGD